MKHHKPVEIREHRDGRLDPDSSLPAAFFVNLFVPVVLVPLYVTVLTSGSMPLASRLFFCLTVTAPIWGVAAALAIGLLPRWRWMSWRKRDAQARSANVARSSVWDDWLDGPS